MLACLRLKREYIRRDGGKERRKKYVSCPSIPSCRQKYFLSGEVDKLNEWRSCMFCHDEGGEKNLASVV